MRGGKKQGVYGKRGSDLGIEFQIRDLIERCDYLIALGKQEAAEAVLTGEPMVALKVQS